MMMNPSVERLMRFGKDGIQRSITWNYIVNFGIVVVFFQVNQDLDFPDLQASQDSQAKT